MVVVAGISEREALIWLTDAVQATSDPTLSADELRRLLPVAAVADSAGNAPDAFSPWLPSTAFSVGEYVVPAPRNGYLYQVTVAGTSGATPPTWPLTVDATITDGTVTWANVEALPWVPTYSLKKLNAAAALGWERKAAKLGIKESFSADGLSIQANDRRDFMLKMAASYRKKAGGGGIGTMNLRGRTAQGDDCLAEPILVVN